MSPPAPAGPLAGVKVMDLTTVVLGPFATQILAGLGAQVVKVEAPGGDDMRRVGPMANPGMGALFLHANQGKRSLVLDLKHPRGREAAQRLAAASDVFITNVRPQALARLGLDEAALRPACPRLIHVLCCGFGPQGPYAGLPAYDDLIQGAAAVPWLVQRHGGGEPRYAPLTLADRVTGLHAVYAVTAALYERERSGLGQAVQVPMFEAMAQLVLGDHLAGLSFEPPRGEAGYARLLTPQRRPYRTSDGYLCVLIYNDKQWSAFLQLVGETPGLDARFASHEARAQHIDAVYAQVAAWMLQRSTAQWQAALAAADIPCQPLNRPEDLLHDPHLAAVGLVQRREHPSEGPQVVLGQPTGWSRSGEASVAPAPRLGEHSAQVLAELGYSAQEIAALCAAGASAQAPV